MTTLGPVGYAKGWNTKAGPLTIQKDQMSDAQNVYIAGGQLYKRNGSAALNSSAFGGGAAVTGGIDWQTAAGQHYFVMTAGAKIGQCADLSGTITDITGAVTITTGANNQSTWSSLNNILVRCGGATPDAPIKWTGTGNAAALGGTPPSGRLTTVVNNFMFIAGTIANPSRIYWSNVGDPETWGASNFVDFRVSDGDQITAIAPLGQNLCIFKKHSIGLLYTTPPSSAVSVSLGPLITVAIGIGCAGGQSLDVLPDGSIVFLSLEAHLIRFDGTALTDLSDKDDGSSSIQPTLDNLIVGRLPYVVVKSYNFRSEIWISASISASTTNNIIYVYNAGLQVWESAYTGIAANMICQSIDTRANPSHAMILLTGNYSGTVYEQDKGYTNAEDTNGNIDGWGTVSVQFGGDSRDFIPRSILLPYEYVTNTTLEVNYGFGGFTDVNYSSPIMATLQGAKLDQFVLDQDVLASGTGEVRKPIIINYHGASSSMQVQFRSKYGSQSFKINPFYISDEVLS